MKEDNFSLKTRLKEYTLAPADEANIKKTIFAGKQLITQNPVQKLSLNKRVFNQFKYISPFLWITQFLALFLCIFIISKIDTSTDITSVLSLLSFIIIFIAVLGFPEVCKSFSYQMWELEQSCKYNLRQIVTIKLALIGMSDLVIILLIAAFSSTQIKLPILETALYLLVPFNVACIISFFAISLMRNKLFSFSLFPVGLGISFVMLICINRFSLYQKVSVPIWTVLFLVTSAVLFAKVTRVMKEIENGGFILCN